MLDWFPLYVKAHRPFHYYLTIASTLAIWLFTAMSLLVLFGNPPLQGLGVLIAPWNDYASWEHLLLLAPPLCLCAQAYALSWRSGIWNFGVPAMFSVGLFATVATLPTVGVHTVGEQFLISLPFAVLSGVLIGWLFAVLEYPLMVPAFISSLLLSFGAQTWLESSDIFLQRPTFSLPVFYVAVLSSVILSLLLWWFLRHMVSGSRLAIRSFSPPLSRFLGMSDNRARWLSLTISGALCGFAASLLWYQAPGEHLDHYSLPLNTAWVALLVAVLGNGNPLAIVFLTVLYAGINVSVDNAPSLGLPSNFAFLLQTTLLVIYISVDGMARYKVLFNTEGGTRG